MQRPHLPVTPKTHKRIHALKRKFEHSSVDKTVDFLIRFYEVNQKSYGEVAAELAARSGRFA